ncbi:mRNA surveillance protein pelota [Theileria parva strain Muguga]|uniref:mRNA surveillance protein pelota n=1 Tax=Theileria parva strain Muguga TaxID=333668 RepID=UPI001C619601|nr:mRNA surveillance protein pelota [Theileria parva strain Muguga]EAN32638.2 mRNA surveillance protein pelota [Theileria parva strain Muguga]
MKLLHRHKTHTGGIQLKLFLETHDDLWFLYNIAFKGDLIEGFTSRKIKTENCNSICVKQEIKKFTIRLCIESVQYTTSYDDIHVTGTNVLENPYVKIGQYHTLDVQPNSTITLFKEEWNKLCEDKLSHILNVSMNAEQAFLVIDNGRASFFLLSQYMTKEVFKLIHNIPIRKTSSHRSSNSSKSSESFYRMILDKIDSELDFKVLRMVVITGPGIFKDLFFEYMKANSLNLNHVNIHKNLSRFILCNSSFSDKNAINEVLSNPLLSSKLNYVFYHDHNKVLDELKTRLEMNDEKVCFGFDDIYNAVTLGAVESILVSDNVIREASSTTRRKIHELVDEVKHYGGGVYYFSDNHCATEYIKNLTGLVALLRFVI